MGMNIKYVYRSKRREFTKKEYRSLLEAFEAGKKPSEISKETGRPLSTIYRHYSEWNKNKLDNYVTAINEKGQESHAPDWQSVGAALIALGKALCGNDTVRSS
jgi:DNA invertase Pin-like site-specific DNA recombinase